MSQEKPLLNSEHLPNSLWDAENELLSLPPALAQSYQAIVDRNQLRELSRERSSKDPPIGGGTKERTDQHFAQQFDGSAARAQLALMDPKGAVPAMSNGIVKALSGNALTLTDAPCGAGAAAFAFLCAIAELRAEKILPRQPLDVLLIGAELSEHARSYAQEMLDELLPKLEEQAVFVEARFDRWDATCSLSTADLVRHINIASTDHPKSLLVVANFSGFLTSSSKWKSSRDQVRELFLHSSHESGFAAWIEPEMNKVTSESGLFSWIRKALTLEWRPFAKEADQAEGPQPVAKCSARFRLPLDPAKTARVRLAVMPIELVRSR